MQNALTTLITRTPQDQAEANIDGSSARDDAGEGGQGDQGEALTMRCIAKAIMQVMILNHLSGETMNFPPCAQTNHTIELVGWLVGWLIGWLVGWLIDWLVD
jgi:hypothetical protein